MGNINDKDRTETKFIDESKFMMSCQEEFDKEPCMKAYKDINSVLINLSKGSSEEDSCVIKCQKLFAKEPCIGTCKVLSLLYKLSSIEDELEKTRKKPTNNI